MEAISVLNAVQDGYTTPEEIAEAIDEETERVILALELLSSMGALEKRQNATIDGLGTQYAVDDASMVENGVASSTDNPKKMPVNRDYNWDAERVNKQDHTEFYTRGDTKKKILSEIERRNHPNAREPIFWLTGPVGSGKTLLAKDIAAELDAVFLTIQGRYSMSSASIVGSPMLVGDNSVWVDGPATKAVLSSQEQPTVLFFDEGNRARPEAKEVIYSLLDDRTQLSIEKRDEVIKGDPSNLIIIITTNEGDQNIVQNLDIAEVRRYGNKHETHYLGFISDEDTRDMVNHEGKPEHFEKAAKLISERSGAPLQLSKDIVATANEIRSMARSNSGAFRTEVPTSALINWAQTTVAYWEAGIDNPLVEAGHDAVVRPFYYSSDTAYDEVSSVISGAFQEAPIDEDEYKQWAEKDMNEFVTEQEA